MEDIGVDYFVDGIAASRLRKPKMRLHWQLPLDEQQMTRMMSNGKAMAKVFAVVDLNNHELYEGLYSRG